MRNWTKWRTTTRRRTTTTHVIPWSLADGRRQKVGAWTCCSQFSAQGQQIPKICLKSVQRKSFYQENVALADCVIRSKSLKNCQMVTFLFFHHCIKSSDKQINCCFQHPYSWLAPGLMLKNHRLAMTTKLFQFNWINVASLLKQITFIWIERYDSI